MLHTQLVVKSQILAGGRGLGTFKSGLKGGVHIVNRDQVPDIAGNLSTRSFLFFSLISESFLIPIQVVIIFFFCREDAGTSSRHQTNWSSRKSCQQGLCL